MTPGAPLLGPPIETQTIDSFLVHVSSLHRAPARRAPKEPALKGRWEDKGTLKRPGLYCLTRGERIARLNVLIAKHGDERLSTIGEREITEAAEALAVTCEALKAYLITKRITSEERPLP